MPRGDAQLPPRPVEPPPIRTRLARGFNTSGVTAAGVWVIALASPAAGITRRVERFGVGSLAGAPTLIEWRLWDGVNDAKIYSDPAPPAGIHCDVPDGTDPRSDGALGVPGFYLLDGCQLQVYADVVDLEWWVEFSEW